MLRKQYMREMGITKKKPWEDKNQVDRYIYENYIKNMEKIGNHLNNSDNLFKKEKIKIKGYKKKRMIIEIGPKERKEGMKRKIGKTEIKYKIMMKIRKKYRGEYVNKSHISELLKGFCGKIIKWEDKKEQKIFIEEKKIKINKEIMNISNKSKKEERKIMIIPKINYLTWNLKEEIEKEKREKKKEEERNEEKEKRKKRKIKLRQEWNLIEKWKKKDKILTKMMKMKRNKEMEKGKDKIIWKYIINYFGWKIPVKERKEAKDKEQKEKIIKDIIENEKVRNTNNKINEYPIKWISRAYKIPIEIEEKDEEKMKNNKIIEEKEEEEYSKETKININASRTKIITNINKSINKKTIEYISKTKNIYGSIIYLKNYWKYIINSYFPKGKRNIRKDISRNLTNKEKSILSTNKDANKLRKEGNKKCIIKRKLLEQKAIEIIEKERPLIGIYKKIKKKKEKKIKGKKKRSKIDIKGKRDIQKIKQTGIIKTEIMFTNVIKIMENIKWK